MTWNRFHKIIGEDMGITIRDIAKHCGVGVATVSRTINNSGYVRADVKERIRNFIQENNWNPSTTAQKTNQENENMNKTELIAAVAEDVGVGKKDTEQVLNAFFSTVQETLKQNDKVQIPGFGSFEVRERAARTGRNPHTGETIEIAAAKVPAFKPEKGLKDAIQ